MQRIAHRRIGVRINLSGLVEFLALDQPRVEKKVRQRRAPNQLDRAATDPYLARCPLRISTKFPAPLVNINEIEIVKRRFELSATFRCDGEDRSRQIVSHQIADR